MRLHVSGLSAGSSYTVTLRNVETAKGVLPAIAARFAVPAQSVPDFLGSVAEASSYTPILATPNLASIAAQNFTGTFKYDLDARKMLDDPFDRIAFAMELVTKNEGEVRWVWVSMDAFTDNPMMIGIPYSGTGIYWQRMVTDMTVARSDTVSGSVTAGEHLDGNIEFWSSNYGVRTGLAGIGGDGSRFDFNDTPDGIPTNSGYGSMQVHNWRTGETLFAFNKFGGGQQNWLDLGIGTNTDGRQPDWTQTDTAQWFSSGKIYAFVRTVPSPSDAFGTPLDFIAQPRNRRVKAHQSVCFAARALGATSYRWYKNGAPVPGGNGPILEIPDVVGPNAGTYKVLAIGPDGASFSDEATLTVIRDGTVLHLR